MQNIFKEILISVFIIGAFLAPVSPTTQSLDFAAAQTGLGTRIICENMDGGQTIVYAPATCPDGTKVIDGSASLADEAKVLAGEQVSPNLKFHCGILNIAGCLTQFLYWVWEFTAALTRFAGSFLDFFVYYSTTSSSYSNAFVEVAWAGVRDIANIFFIVALLYIAIKTILGLNVTNNKKLVGVVIMVALTINFSLFTTKLIIDSTNILAKVFYNNIVPVDADENILDSGQGDEKSISVGLVDKFDVQNLLTQDTYDSVESKSAFTFLLLFLIFITVYASYIFLSVAVLFVSRVISLWLAMIFSPLAFISYALPFKIDYFGHQDWWRDLLKNAFLAPVFIFLLYIIVMFAGFIKDISYSNSSAYWVNIMTVAIPFIILTALLKKSKETTERFAGEMGKAVMSGAKKVGGLALGGAAGAGALAGTAIVGGGGGYLAGKLAKGASSFGMTRTSNTLKDVGSYARKAKFDVRNIKVAGNSLSSVTGMKLGENKRGGWDDMKKRQVEKRQKRADELEKRGTGDEKKAVDEAEIKLKDRTLELINPATLPREFADLGGLTAKAAMVEIDKRMDRARINLNDAKNSGIPADIASAKAELDDAKNAKETVRNQGNIASGGTGSIKDFEKAVRVAKDSLLVKSEQVTTEFAKKISSGINKNMNQVFRAGALGVVGILTGGAGLGIIGGAAGLGTYSRAADDEAARKIRTGTKLDSGEKPH